MNIPYTYRIQWSKTGMNYYGVRYARDCHPDEFWIKYFTTSDYVTEYRKEHGEPDIIEIRKQFLTENRVDDAREWEHRVLKRLDVIERNDYLNMSDGKGIDPRLASAARTGISPGNKNLPQPEYIKAKKRKPKEVVTCPHCGKSGGISTMRRHHFDNCGKGVSSTTIKKISKINSDRAERNIVAKIKDTWKGIPDRQVRQLRKITRMGRGWYQLPDDDLEKLYLQVVGIDTSFFPKNQKIKLPKIKKIRNNEHTLICPVCNLSGKGPVMKRHHFNNCRFTELLIRSESLEAWKSE
jgi:ssDNA-binding Zn-finger/Zn-ribbon topoisomerase 1